MLSPTNSPGDSPASIAALRLIAAFFCSIRLHGGFAGDWYSQGPAYVDPAVCNSLLHRVVWVCPRQKTRMIWVEAGRQYAGFGFTEPEPCLRRWVIQGLTLMVVDVTDWTGLELAGGRYRMASRLGAGSVAYVFSPRDRNLDADSC